MDPEQLFSIHFEGTWGWGLGYMMHQYLRLMKQDESYYFEYENTGEDGIKVVERNEIEAEVAERLMQRLKKIELPTFPEHHMGCDGCFRELEIGGYDGKSVFRWWTDGPKEWQALDRFVRLAVKVSGFRDAG